MADFIALRVEMHEFYGAHYIMISSKFFDGFAAKLNNAMEGRGI